MRVTEKKNNKQSKAVSYFGDERETHKETATERKEKETETERRTTSYVR